MKTTEEVLAYHAKCLAARDIDGVLAGYSEDAVFFGHGDVLRGPNAIKTVFEALFAEFARLGLSVTRKQRAIEGDYAYIV